MEKSPKKTPPLLVPDWLYTNGFSRLQRDALCFVAMRGKCFQNKATMAQLLSCNRSALREALKELVVFGWLKHTKKNRSDCYQVSSEGKPIIRVKRDANKRTHSPSGAFEKAPNGALEKAPNGATNYVITNCEDINYEERAKEDLLLYRRRL